MSFDELAIFRPELVEPIRWLLASQRTERPPIIIQLRMRFQLTAAQAIAAIRLADELRREARR